MSNLENSWLDYETFRTLFEKKEIQEFPNELILSVETPLVSVLLVTYNHVAFIRKSIESVLEQKFDFNFEIIIVDDESSDGTREICIEYALKFPEKIRLFLHSRTNNIKVLEKPCGIFQITHGLFNLRGKYFAILSGDDYWGDARKLQLQFDIMTASKDLSYCYHRWQRVNENDEIMGNSYNTDMPLTIFGLNIFNRIPIEFLNVIQEDTFMKEMLKTKGRSIGVEGIDPASYRIHGNNMWGVEDNLFKHESRINTALNMLKAYKKSDFELQFKQQATTSILMKFEFLFKKKEVKNARLNIRLIVELSRNNLLFFYLTNFVQNKLRLNK